VPYNPEENGKVERMMSTLQGSMRASMVGVDRSLWCYFVEMFSNLHSNIRRRTYPDKRFNGLSPNEVLRIWKNRDTNPDLEAEAEKIRKSTPSPKVEKNLRRFGCLAYVKIPKENVDGKLGDRARPCVFLGFSEGNNSCWRFGTYRFLYNKWRFVDDIESEDAVFIEDCLVHSIGLLRPEDEEGLVENKFIRRWFEGGAKAPQELERMEFEQSGQPPEHQRGDVLNLGPEDSHHVQGGSPPIEVSQQNVEGLSEGDRLAESERDVQVESRHSSPPKDSKRRKIDVEPGPEPEVTVKVKRGRGRPEGSKDKKERKKRGPKKIVTAAMYAVIAAFAKSSPSDFAKSYPEYASIPKPDTIASALDAVDVDLENEEIIEVTLQLSVAEALRSDDAPEWIAAIDKEKCRLESFKCWRPLSEPEYREAIADRKHILPIAIILTRKRDQSFKARACVLGNRQLRATDAPDVFSPVISHGGIRYICTAAAAAGDYIQAFDISSAFIQSPISEHVIVKLPPTFVKNHRDSYVKLVKAMYGLRSSPLAWQQCYHKKLEELGWSNCPTCPGMYRKLSVIHPTKYLKLGVYVDDNILSGPDQKETQRETNAILEVFSGTMIPSEEVIVDGVTYNRWDILGADFLYNRRMKTMRFVMTRYIVKFLKKFGFEHLKPATNPCFSESSVVQAALNAEKDGRKSETYPVREILGCLNWIATTARPDLAMPVGALSRIASKPVTGELKSAVRKIARYLRSTLDDGVIYSPSNEKNFNEVYSKLLVENPNAPKTLPKVNLFSDASWASDFQTMKSMSGNVCYYRGTPVIWKSQRQSIRAASTYESEWVSCSDVITLHSHNKFLEYFEATPRDDHLIWVDSMSALQVARGSADRPRSRHVALRWFNVREEAQRLCFCPTTLQRADPLTKVECSPEARRLILWANKEPDTKNRIDEDEDDSSCYLFYVDSSFRNFLK
jgi:hypothetical protein